MLPQARTYLVDGGSSPRQASFLLIGLFLAGVIVIRGVSAILHHFIPSHVVDCDHQHGDEESDLKDAGEMSETTLQDERAPLLPSSPRPQESSSLSQPKQRPLVNEGPRRPSALSRTLTRTFSKYVQGQKDNCDESGPCKGFTDPCGQDCFRFMQRRTSGMVQSHDPLVRQPTWSKLNFSQPVVEENDETDHATGAHSPHDARQSRTQSNTNLEHGLTRVKSATHHIHHPEGAHGATAARRPTSTHSHTHSDVGEHHHHVPTNAFMSIGLQTSIAIALHKAPEGFITYATNHANPTLGFAVFMALFIHNITEGFAMSLPLYLALGSRFKAIVWSSFLGGASQPLGAGIAALWFKLAQKSASGGPDETVYGAMFAITAGVMTSVAISLFSESLQLSHKKGICITFAFIGMGVLGVSSALTAK